MEGKSEDLQQNKGRELAPEIRSARIAATVAVISAMFSFIASCGENISGWVQTQDELEFRVTELQSEHLGNMTGDYHTKKNTIKMIASLYGVATAVSFEGAFRSGATIRGLRELEQSLPNNEESHEERTLINESLENVPRLAFIDSREHDNIYCDESIFISATNVDDIINLIIDYPVIIDGYVGDLIGIEVLQDSIRNNVPDYIVMHVGSFQGVDDGVDDVSKVSEFIDGIGDYFNGTIILYSRNTNDLDRIHNDENENITIRKVIMERDRTPSDGVDDNCFSKGSVNESRIIRVINDVIAWGA